VNQRVADTAPGIFTANSSGTGAGVILNQNAVSNSSDNRAAKGSPISMYATGEGQTAPAGSNGVVTPLNGSGLRTPVASVSVTIGGIPCQVLYAGSAPGIVSGIMQVTVLIPPTAPSGPAVPIVLTVGSASSQPNVTLAIQ
jgi:trimeric autotransporter adhesin